MAIANSNQFGTEMLKCLGINDTQVLNITLEAKPNDIVRVTVTRAVKVDDAEVFLQEIEKYGLCKLDEVTNG